MAWPGRSLHLRPLRTWPGRSPTARGDLHVRSACRELHAIRGRGCAAPAASECDKGERVRASAECLGLIRDPSHSPSHPPSLSPSRLHVRIPLPRPLRVTRRPLRVTRRPLRVTRRPLRVTRRPLRVTRRPLRVTRRPLRVTRRPLRVTRRPLRVTRRPLRITRPSSAHHPSVVPFLFPFPFPLSSRTCHYPEALRASTQPRS
jgi:hypothetical protein